MEQKKYKLISAPFSRKVKIPFSTQKAVTDILFQIHESKQIISLFYKISLHQKDFYIYFKCRKRFSVLSPSKTFFTLDQE